MTIQRTIFASSPQTFRTYKILRDSYPKPSEFITQPSLPHAYGIPF